MLEQLDQILDLPLAWLLVALGVSAFLEYVFPPFPGDTVTVLGAYAVFTGKASLLSIFGAVILGSLLGLSVVYQGGVWLAKRSGGLGQLKESKGLGRFISPPRLALVAEQYRKHGLWLILANRFLPVTRAIFFVFAGMSGVSYWRTLVLGGISSIAWNGMLLAIGLSIGANIEALKLVVDNYSRQAWPIVLVLLALGLGVWGLRRWSRRRAKAAMGR